MQSSVETAKSAIAAMQQGSGPSVLQAGQWLSDLEQSQEAWGVAWDLVNGEGTSSEETMYRFFGAKIIYTKIQRDFDELGSDQIADFTQKLVSRTIDLSQKYGEDVSFVVCRYLCLSIAAIALQVNREGVVNQILTWFNPILQSAPRVMLELLYLLPEECDNYQIDVDRDTRDMFAYQLTESFNDVASFLQSLMEAPGCTDFTKIKILNCLAAWIECTFVAGSQVAVHPTFAAALASLHSSNTEVMEAAVEVIIGTFERFGSSNQDILANSWPKLVNLAPYWQQACSSPDCEEGDDAYDVCKHIARLVTGVSDNCSRFLLQPSSDAAMHACKQGLFQLLLECCKHPLDDISCIPLSFVDNFTGDLTDLYLTFVDESDDRDKGSSPARDSDRKDGRARASPTEAWQYVKEAYFGHLLSLLQTCTLQCARSSAPCLSRTIQAITQGHAGAEGDIAFAEGAQKDTMLSEEAEDQRKKWLSAVQSVCSLIDRVHGPDAPMLALAESLRKTVEEARNVVVSSPSHVLAAAELLSGLEAHLHLLTAGLPYITTAEAQAAPWLFEHVFLSACPLRICIAGLEKTIPMSSIPQLFATILTCVGAASKWLSNPQVGARYLPPSLSMCSAHVTHTCFQRAAASSLNEMLKQCGHLDGAHEEAMKIHTILLAARGQGLALSADLHLLEGICDVLGAYCGKVVDAEGERQLHNYLLAIIEPMISALGAALHLPPPPPNSSPAVTSAGTQHQAYAGHTPGAAGGENGADKTNDGVIISLERLCLVLRCLRLKPDLYMGLLQQQVLSLLHTLLEKRPYSQRLCEKVCRCYKHAMRNAAHAFTPLLPALLQHLSKQFSRQHDPGYVYIVAVAVGEYCRGCYHDANRMPGPLLLEAITDITDVFFGHFGSPEAFAQRPDVVEEYFCLLQKTLQVAPALYFCLVGSDREVASLGRPFRDIVYTAGIAALQTSHADVHKAAATFFSTLMTTADGTRRRGKEERNDDSENQLRAAALQEIRNGAGMNLVVGTLRFVASQDAKVALGGDTDKLGKMLLTMGRVMSRADRENGTGGQGKEFEGWLRQASAILDGLGAADTASIANSSADSGGNSGGMRPGLAITKGKVCELFIRGDEDLALDAFYRFHRNCVGGRE